MGRPPSNGGPSFRFNPTEVQEMEAMLQAHNLAVPGREVLEALAEKFSKSAERSGKVIVQMKQVWNWFQNRRYALRARAAKAPTVSQAPRPIPALSASSTARTMPQAPQPLLQAPQPLSQAPQQLPQATQQLPQAPQPLPQAPQPLPQAPQPLSQAPQPLHHVPQSLPLAPPIQTSVQNAGRTSSDNSQMEFEAKSARDGAWYDVAHFLSHKSLETGDPEVLVRFAGFGPEEDEWVNVRRHVRQRSLPCESAECVAVLPGDLILCFQEGKEQALYFDAHVLDAQRRRHDVRGCRCRFLVRYDHDQSEEIVPLRKVCRRPESDYRLQQLHAESAAMKQQKTGFDPHAGNTTTMPDPSAEIKESQPKAEKQVDGGVTARPATRAYTAVSNKSSTEIAGIGGPTNPTSSPVNNDSKVSLQNITEEVCVRISDNPSSTPISNEPKGPPHNVSEIAEIRGRTNQLVKEVNEFEAASPSAMEIVGIRDQVSDNPSSTPRNNEPKVPPPDVSETAEIRGPTNQLVTQVNNESEAAPASAMEIVGVGRVSDNLSSTPIINELKVPPPDVSETAEIRGPTNQLATQVNNESEAAPRSAMEIMGIGDCISDNLSSMPISNEPKVPPPDVSETAEIRGPTNQLVAELNESEAAPPSTMEIVGVGDSNTPSITRTSNESNLSPTGVAENAEVRGPSLPSMTHLSSESIASPDSVVETADSEIANDSNSSVRNLRNESAVPPPEAAETAVVKVTGNQAVTTASSEFKDLPPNAAQTTGGVSSNPSVTPVSTEAIVVPVEVAETGNNTVPEGSGVLPPNDSQTRNGNIAGDADVPSIVGPEETSNSNAASGVADDSVQNMQLE